MNLQDVWEADQKLAEHGIYLGEAGAGDWPPFDLDGKIARRTSTFLSKSTRQLSLWLRHDEQVPFLWVFRRMQTSFSFLGRLHFTPGDDFRIGWHMSGILDELQFATKDSAIRKALLAIFPVRTYELPTGRTDGIAEEIKAFAAANAY